MEFRRLTMLVSLLTSINSDGRRVTSESPELMITSLEGRTQPIRSLAMNTLAILLIHHHEVVAVTATTPDHTSTFSNRSDSDAPMPIASNMQDLAKQEANPIPESKYAEAGIMDFIVTSNPERPKSFQDHLPDIWKNHPTAQYMVVPPGRSSWKVVKISAWSQV
jgi:hypothetical protein